MNDQREMNTTGLPEDGSLTQERRPRSADPLPFSEPIVFFDGVCGFCNRTVNWLLIRDTSQKLRFAPLQGTTAAEMLPEQIRVRLDSLVLTMNRQVFLRTAAVCRILMILGGRWKLLGIMLWLIPVPLRDLGYRIIARVRYRLFGKLDSCRLPLPHERQVFLD